MTSIVEMFPAEFNAWCKMRSRCYDPKDKDFKNYGGRGVTVCQAWRESFRKFLEDVGPKPAKDRLIWLGRIDIRGNYEPGNVAWVKHQRQISHRRYCHRIPCGEQVLTISEAERALGLPKEVLRNRLFQYRMPLERALVRGRIRYRKDSPLVTFNGETLSVPEWAKRLGVKVATLHYRLRSQLPPERVLHPGSLREKGLRAKVSTR